MPKDNSKSSESPEVMNLLEELEAHGKQHSIENGKRFPFNPAIFPDIKTRKRVKQIYNDAGVEIDFIWDSDDKTYARVTKK